MSIKLSPLFTTTEFTVIVNSRNSFMLMFFLSAAAFLVYLYLPKIWYILPKIMINILLCTETLETTKVWRISCYFQIGSDSKIYPNTNFTYIFNTISSITVYGYYELPHTLIFSFPD